MKISFNDQIYIGEEEVKELVEEAVRNARRFTEGNMANEAIVQYTMEYQYGPGGWRSKLFLPITDDGSTIHVTDTNNRQVGISTSSSSSVRRPSMASSE